MRSDSSLPLLLLGGLAWLTPAGADPIAVPVRVGVFDNPPIVSAPADGPPRGIAIDVLEVVATRENWNIVYVADTWDRQLARLDRGELDLMVGIAYSEERAQRFQFSRQSLIGNWGIVLRRADVPIQSLPDLKNRRVALMRNSTHSHALVKLAEQFDARFTPVYVDTYPQVLEAIAGQRADAGTVNRVFGALHAHDNGVVETGIVFNPVFVHYAAPKDADPALLQALDRQLAALKADSNSAYYTALRHWLEARAVNRQPAWLPWAAAAAAGLLILTLVVVMLLRHQVARQTGELQRHTERLQREIEQREQAQEHLHRVAFFDGLTQLPNREAFRHALDQALADSSHDRTQLALLFIDVDRLKNVNDGLGHGAGDLLLQQVAARLQSVLRAHDHLSRFGGDEFVVIVSAIHDPSDAELVATRLLASLETPIEIGTTQVYTGASIGIAFYPDDATTVDDLLKHADTAMYLAKEQGGNRYLFYHAHQTTRVVERLTLDTRLRRALERGELLLHYQPIVELSSQAVVGVEALVRWQDPEHGLVLPDSFIPAAEDTGLIIPLGEWVLEAACVQLRAWQQLGLNTPLSLAINISTRQFEGPRLIAAVERALDRSGIRPSMLELEITENVMLAMNDNLRSTLEELRELGVRLSLDDFGTGYSSLSYLHQLPFQGLKIDRSFIHTIPGKPGDTQLVTTILAMARGLGLQTVAEGVENRDQLEFLRRHNCEYGQGYWFSQPLPADALMAYLKTASTGKARHPGKKGTA